MVTYELVEENHKSILGHYTSFGIKAFENFSEEKIIYIEDVFNDIETAKECIALFNDEQLDLIHLEEAIENILHLHHL